VGLNHLSGNFLILPIGLGASVVVLVMEITWKKLEVRKKLVSKVPDLNLIRFLRPPITTEHRPP
jgi:hypothetical protein